MQLIFSIGLHPCMVHALRDSAVDSNRNVSMYNTIISSSLAVPMQLKFFKFLILIGSITLLHLQLFKCLILIGSITLLQFEFLILIGSFFKCLILIGSITLLQFEFLILIGSFFKCLILGSIASISSSSSLLLILLLFFKFRIIVKLDVPLCLVLKQNLNTLYLNVMSVLYVSLQCVTRYKPSVVISSVAIVWSLFWNVVIQSVPSIKKKSPRREHSLTMLAGGRFWSCRCFATSKTVLGSELSKIWRYI